MPKKKKRKYVRWLGDPDYRRDLDNGPDISPPCKDNDGGAYPGRLLRKFIEPGLFFGQPPDDPNSYVGMPSGCDGHIAVIGGSGSGKTSAIVKPTMKTWENPMVLTDCKGELSDHYGTLFRNGLVHRAFITFDPMQIDGPCYDPFKWVSEDDEANLISNINEIALVIVPDILNNINSYWDDLERRSLAAALLYYYLIGLSFSEAMCKIASSTLSELCEQLGSCSDVRVRTLLGDMSELKPEHLAAIDSGLRNKILVFAEDPHIAHAFRGAREEAKCFYWDDLEEYNIFIRIPEGKIEQWGKAINLMYVQLIRYLERRPEKYSPAGAASKPTLLMMDEFARFGKIDHLPDAISTLRSKNVNICLIIQSIAQLDKIYGQYDRRIILDNCNYKAILGANDAETQRYLCELIGSEKVLQKSISEHMDEFMDVTGYSSQVSEARECRVFPDELACLNDIILLSPYGAYRIEKYQRYDLSGELYRSYPAPVILKAAAVLKADVPGTPTIPAKAMLSEKKLSNSFNNNEVDKMLTYIERLNNVNDYIDQVNLQAHIVAQAEQAAEIQENNLVSAVGKLVVDYFPELSYIDPGNTETDAERNLAAVEAVIAALAADRDIIQRAAEKVRFAEKMAAIKASMSDCVDGR